MKLDQNDILGSGLGRAIHPAPIEKMFPGKFETSIQEIFPSSISNTKAAVRAFKEAQPHTYKQFFSKIYQDVDAFCNWRIPLLYSALHIHGGQAVPEYYEGVQAGTNALAHALRWHAGGLPLFFVQKSFYDAVRQTEVPAEFDLASMKWPFPAYTFVLPRGALSYRGAEIPFISVSVCRGDSIRSELGTLEVSPDVHKVIITTAFNNSYFAPGFKIAHLRKFYDMQADTFVEVSRTSDLECDGVMEDAAFSLTILKLALKLTVAMEAVPEHVEFGRMVGITVKSCQKKELWKPNVIGRRYSIRSSDGSGSGGHSSPRAHWRRGHFRRQGVGPRATECENCSCSAILHYKAGDGGSYCQNAACSCPGYQKPGTPFKEYKVLWIEPVFVTGSSN